MRKLSFKIIVFINAAIGSYTQAGQDVSLIKEPKDLLKVMPKNKPLRRQNNCSSDESKSSSSDHFCDEDFSLSPCSTEQLSPSSIPHSPTTLSLSAKQEFTSCKEPTVVAIATNKILNSSKEAPPLILNPNVQENKQDSQMVCEETQENIRKHSYTIDLNEQVKKGPLISLSVLESQEDQK